MTKVTVSSKVPSDLTDRISKTGFSTSDVMQVGLEMFLALPRDQQVELISRHIQQKKRQRVIERYAFKGD